MNSPLYIGVSTSCWKVEFQARVRETSSSSRSERVQEGLDFRLNYVMKEEPT